MSEVQFDHVSKRFAALDVIPDLSLTVPSGSFTVLVGPSGCGKSTLLRIVSGLETQSSGRVVIDGTDVSRMQPSDRGIAMVFQSYALYPHMTVEKNISFALRLAGMPKADIDLRVARAAEILQLDGLLDRKPAQLSGGQRQRVAIGRAIVREPKVFLFDEPLSNLDAALRGQMRVELLELHAKLGATMLYVTHDQIEAMTMADQIVILNRGRIEQVGRPLEVYDRPATPFVAGFIGSPRMNLLTGAAAQPFGGDTLGFRPEHIALSVDGGRWRGRISLLEHLGNQSIAHIESDVGTLLAQVTREAADLQGQTIFITPDPTHLHVFRDGVRLAA
jgi:ABC-type sugar transport system ATPase subunit